MALQTSANCKFYIGTTSPATDLASFKGDTYKEVGSIEDLGEFGDQFNQVTFTSLGDGRVRKLKGTKDAGDMTLVVAFDGDDEGQAALLAAAEDTTSVGYNCKVELNDMGTTNPTTFYFRAQVMGARVAIGGADNVIRRNVTIAIDSDVIMEEAA